MNGYIFFFNGRQIEVYADSMLEAKEKAIASFKPAKSKRHMVHGMIAEKDGKPVTHSTTNL